MIVKFMVKLLFYRSIFVCGGTYIEDLFDRTVDFRVVLIRRFVKVTGDIASQVSKHTRLSHSLHSQVGCTLQVRAAAT